MIKSEVLKRSVSNGLSTLIAQRRLRLAGQALRMSEHRFLRVAMWWNSEGLSRDRGGWKNAWEDIRMGHSTTKSSQRRRGRIGASGSV